MDEFWVSYGILKMHFSVLYLDQCCIITDYSLTEWSLFFTVCWYERILSLGVLLLTALKKHTEKLERFGVIVFLGSFLDFISVAALLFSAG